MTGKTAAPKTLKDAEGELHGTDEFLQGANPNEWLTRYFVTSELNGKDRIVEYGTLKLNFTVPDSNSNNVPDIIDAKAPFHGVGAGIRMTDFLAPGRSSAIPDDYHIQLDRNAGDIRGTWMFGGGGTQISGGYYETPHTSGYFNYYRGDTKNFLDFYFTFPFQYTAKTFCSVPDPDRVLVKAMTLLSPDRKPIRAMPFTFMRTGNNYWGMVNFTDGDTTNPIKDYRWWMFVLTEPNDTDSDGIGNFSDYRTLRITRQPVGRTLKVGSSLTLSAAYKPFGKDPIGPVDFQWYHNGSPITGATDLKYTLRGFQSGDAGDYQLKLHSPAGDVFSMSAKLGL